jgi:predicted permease
MAPMMIVASVPLYNIFSVIILTFHSNEATKDTNMIKTACINILKNPIIIAIFAALVVALLEIPIPDMALKTVSNVAATATPLALLVVGATFEGKKAISKIKPTALATFIKLILLPVLFLPLAYLFGFRDSKMVAILVMLASPTTVTCYIMAKNMHNDAVLSSSIVVTATLFSSVTLTMWVYLLRILGLI